MMGLPRYRCIKTVWALEITLCHRRESGELEFHFIERGPAVLPAELAARYMPEPGDFLVIYSDGYKSVSPRKAFLEGYVRDDDDPVRDMRER